MVRANKSLQGVSYTLTNLAVPALLSLPSASSASRAFHSLVQSATPHLRALSFLPTTAFALAFVLSPRAHRHPYLLYASVLSFASAFAPARVAPLLLGAASSTSGGSGSTTPKPAAAQPKRAKAGGSSSRMMESSYEVLGSDNHSEGSAASVSGEDVDVDDVVNGEGVRGEVENWLKARVVQTGIAAVAFMISVVGIWGDGAAQMIGTEVVIL